ncbi:MAG: hypothetical protein AAFR39_05475 [Pseudomonadota bacterium]
MSGIERTLMQTLAKGNANDAEFRKRVYNAAANALRRSLESQGNLTEAAAQAQRDKLADAIRAVESRYQIPIPPNTSAPEVSASAPSHSVPRKKQPVGRIEPILRAEPKVDAVAAGSKTAKNEDQSSAGPFRLKRGPFAAGLGTIALIGILLVGIFWVMLSGAFQDPELRDTSVPNPPPETETESFEPRDPGTATAPALRSEQQAQGDWVTIFTPDDIATLRLQGAASAESSSDPFGNFVLIITPAGSSASIELPPGPLQALLGQRAQVEITAKTSDGQTTQMAVECQLGPDIDCVRTRFVVGQSPEAFTYRIDLTNVRRLQSGGRLVINSDLEGEGKEIKLISVRIRAEESA